MTDPMRACDRCGSSVPASAGTCPNCGAPLEVLPSRSEEAEYIVTDDLASLATRPTTKADSSAPQNPQIGVAPPEASSPVSPVQAPQRRSRWLWVLLGCSILGLIICASVVFLAFYLVYY